DRDLEDVFAVQDEVTRTIVDALKVKLTAGEEARLESRGKIDPEAYDLIVRSRQTSLQLRPEAALEPPRLLERVIEIDPKLAISYARLAIIRFAEYANQWNDATAEYLTQARALAHQAIETDDTEPQGYISLAIILCWMREFDEAERAAERALVLA